MHITYTRPSPLQRDMGRFSLHPLEGHTEDRLELTMGDPGRGGPRHDEPQCLFVVRFLPSLSPRPPPLTSLKSTGRGKPCDDDTHYPTPG